MRNEDKLQLVQGVLNLYSIFFNISNCPHYKVIISKSIFDERLKLCHSPLEEQEICRLRNEFDQLNGTMVGPESDDRTYYLIVSEKRFADGISYIGTVAHEFTHILDFYEYFSKNNLVNTRFIKNSDYSFAKIYSEFRARYRGSLLSWITNNVTTIDKEAFSQLIKQYDDILKDGMNLYFVAQFYGQYLAAKTLDPTFNAILPDYYEGEIKPLLTIITERINDHNMYDSYNQIKQVYDNWEENS